MTTQPHNEFSRYPNAAWLRTHEQRHNTQQDSHQDTPSDSPAVGASDGSPSVRTPERTPHTRWWRLLCLLVALLTIGTTHDLAVQYLPGHGHLAGGAGDCHSLRPSPQGSDLHVCTAVPQPSPSPEVSRVL